MAVCLNPVPARNGKVYSEVSFSVPSRIYIYTAHTPGAYPPPKSVSKHIYIYGAHPRRIPFLLRFVNFSFLGSDFGVDLGSNFDQVLPPTSTP